MSGEDDALVHRLLGELLTAQGLASSRSQFTAEVFRRPAGELFPVQLDVKFELWPGRTVIEAFGGLGKSWPAAIADAVQAFARGTFPVLAGAFLSPATARERWLVDGLERTVTIGEVAVRGRPPAMNNSWFRAVERAVKASTLPAGAHWLRVYFAQREGQVLSLEVLRNNEAWPELQQALQTAPWPTAKDFFSLRVFFVLQGGVDVSQAATLIALGADAQSVRIALSKLGASPAQVERLQQLVPLAFGRVALRTLKVHLPETAIVRGEGSERSISLRDEPIYRDALQLAEARSLSRETFDKLAAASPEVRAVAASGTTAIEGSVLGPPVLTFS